MGINAGKLRHLIKFQHDIVTRDATGQKISVWANFRTARAGISPRSSAEAIAGDQIESIGSHRIDCRYIAGITAAMRIKFGTRIFQIVGIVNPDERNQWLEIECREIL